MLAVGQVLFTLGPRLKEQLELVPAFPTAQRWQNHTRAPIPQHLTSGLLFKFFWPEHVTWPSLVTTRKCTPPTGEGIVVTEQMLRAYGERQPIAGKSNMVHRQ